MKRIYIFFIGFLIFISAKAETIKTDVLVINGNASGLAAGIQAARSGVKTLILEESGNLGGDILFTNSTAQAGLYAEIIKHIKPLEKDTLKNINPAFSNRIIKALADTVKNLNVRLNSSVKTVEPWGKGWEIKLNDGNTIKAEMVIDATLNSAFATLAAQVVNTKSGGTFRTILQNPALTVNYKDKLYRTSVGINVETKTGVVDILPLGVLVAYDLSNVLIPGKAAANQSVQNAMFTGQASGALAAYCAFFHKTTKELDVRAIQNELITYKSQLFPYQDIKYTDPNYIALQHIGLTGILKADITNSVKFNPDGSVSSEEIRSAMKEYYSRSQIWFADKKVDKLTLNDALSLIKYCGSRGEELNNEVKTAWKSSFKFSSGFDLKKIITRREFAVLLDSYLKPYTVRVDLGGKLGS